MVTGALNVLLNLYSPTSLHNYSRCTSVGIALFNTIDHKCQFLTMQQSFNLATGVFVINFKAEYLLLTPCR